MTTNSIKSSVSRNAQKAAWERNRVAKKSAAFDALRAKLSESMPVSHRTTQLDTLQAAIDRIMSLQAMLNAPGETQEVSMSFEMPAAALVAPEYPEASQEVREEEDIDHWFIPQEQLQVPQVDQDFPVVSHLPAPVQEVVQNPVAPESPEASQQVQAQQNFSMPSNFQARVSPLEVYETPQMTHAEYVYDQGVFYITPFFSHPISQSLRSPAPLPQEEVLMYQPAYYQ